MDESMRGGHRETHWQVDFQALDRQERLIITRMLGGLAIGVFLGLIGELLAEVLPANAAAIYDPYLYGVLVLVVAYGSASAGWAALNGLLTTAGLMAGHLIAYALNHEESLLSRIEDGWQISLGITVAVFGLVGYLSRRRDLGGDVSVGLFSGLLFSQGGRELQQMASLAHGGPPPSGPWAIVSLAVMALAFPILLRPTTATRLRALFIALACAAVLILPSANHLPW